MSNVFMHMYYEQLQIAVICFRTHEYQYKYEQQDSSLLITTFITQSGNFTE